MKKKKITKKKDERESMKGLKKKKYVICKE